MAAAEDIEADAPKRKKSALPLMLGLVVALALGGGGFFAAYSGMLDSLLGGKEHDGGEKSAPAGPLPPIAFVEMEPMLISLGEPGATRHLRFRAHFEVMPGQSDAVTAQLPRVMDVLNSYLRAISIAELENPAALIRLRAQMLRRVQLVVGENRVRDLLVTEFVLN